MSYRLPELENVKNHKMLSPWTVDEASNGFFMLFCSGLLLVPFFVFGKDYRFGGDRDFQSILSYLGLAGFIWIFLILYKKMKIARAFESDGINIDGVVVKKYSVGDDGYIELAYTYSFEGDNYLGKIMAYESIFKDHHVGDKLTVRFLPFYPYISRPNLTF